MTQRQSANIVGLRVRENFIRSSYVLTAARVLSRIFVWGGGEADPEKNFEPRGGDNKFFLGLLGGPGHAPPENFEYIVFGIG